jgi:probable HAF family extracellular repeat protein
MRWPVLAALVVTAAVLAGCGGGIEDSATTTTSTGWRISADRQWVIRDLGTLGGAATWATAINEGGQVVGASAAVTPEGRLRLHAFVWEGGVMRDLGTLPGYRWSEAMDINERGQVVGRTGGTADMLDAHAFLWDDGEMRDLGLVGDRYADLSINDRGQVLGTRCLYSESVFENCHAFLWEAGRTANLGGKWSWGEQLSERGKSRSRGSNSRPRAQRRGVAP